VLAIGPLVHEVSASFNDYWNSELAYPIGVFLDRPPSLQEIEEARRQLDDFVVQQSDSDYLQALGNSNLVKDIENDRVRFTGGKQMCSWISRKSCCMDGTELHLSSQFKHYRDLIQEELILFSPYFVPGKQGTEFFSKLSKQGVRVRILTNSLASTDVSVVHAGYSKDRKQLLRAVVELYELNKKISVQNRKKKKGDHGGSKASLHAKSFVFDRQRVFIGSFNFDPRSFYENTEIGVLLKSPEMANLMADRFDEYIVEVAFRLELHTDEEGFQYIRWHGLENG
jgi:putative cardiolipin synthase